VGVERVGPVEREGCGVEQEQSRGDPGSGAEEEMSDGYDLALEEWLWVLAEIKELITDLPPDGNKRLYALWKQVKVSRGRRSDQQTPGYLLRDLLIRLSEN
jgi:hypothetical protein